jgi:hypothetical protein
LCRVEGVGECGNPCLMIRCFIYVERVKKGEFGDPERGL